MGLATRVSRTALFAYIAVLRITEVHASNYDDVLHQLLDAGLVIPSREGLRIGTHRPVRVYVVDDAREKRGWYLLKEWSPSVDRLLIVGSYGVWRADDQGTRKIELPKEDGGTSLTPDQRAALKRVWAEAARAAEIQRTAEAAAAALRAQKAWMRYGTDGESPYLTAKQVRPFDTRFTEKGSVVVPMTDTAGRIHGLQFLRSHSQAEEARRPRKEFWPRGIAKKGHFHLLGHQPDWVILIAEGYATAASAHLATQLPVACAFDAGNLLAAAEAIRKRWKRVRILILADDDCWTLGNPGITAASAAAMAVGGEWVRPVFADEEGRQEKHAAGGHKLTDFNDLHLAETLLTVGAQLTSRLTELGWKAPPTRGLSSSTGKGAEQLKPIQFLDDLLRRFAMIHGSNGSVFDRQEHMLITLADVRNVCVRGDLFRAWMEHPDRAIVRQEEVGFDPAETDSVITCNLWAGWPTQPKSGCCERLLDMLGHMCSGERNVAQLYLWVLRWLAYPLQHPGAKLKTCVVVHGPQGTGKNLFFEAVMEIYGRYGRILDQDALTDKHNDWASRRLFLIADEVVAQAHRYEIKNKLKTLITGTSIRINPKHVASYDEANHANMTFLSNEGMPVVVEEDDRRHCVIWTLPKKEKAYYDAVLAEIAEGGVAALHHFLLHLDLGDFSPGAMPPDTEAKRELIGLGQDPAVDFYDALLYNDLLPLKAMPGLTTDWFLVYQRWCTKQGVKSSSLKRFVNAILRKRDECTRRKGYLKDGRITHPQSVLMFSCKPPDCQVESTWLGEQISAMRNRMQDYLGGNSSQSGAFGDPL
jgi:putative DNA primase/helicase